MQTCATLPSMTDRIDIHDPRLNAHRTPMALAGEVIQDFITAADLMQKAIYSAQPQTEIDRHRETARALSETYLDLMAEAATHVRALKPD